jgi:hypothetical protein
MKTKKKRTREDLVVDTFRFMIRHGDAVKHTVTIYLNTGGVMERTFYKVLPNERRK